MILELRHIGTQISSDSYGSIDKSEYITDFFLLVRDFSGLGGGSLLSPVIRKILRFSGCSCARRPVLF